MGDRFIVDLGWYCPDEGSCQRAQTWLNHHYGEGRVEVRWDVIECLNEADAVEISMALAKGHPEPVPSGYGLAPRFQDAMYRKNAHLFLCTIAKLVDVEVETSDWS